MFSFTHRGISHHPCSSSKLIKIVRDIISTEYVVLSLNFLCVVVLFSVLLFSNSSKLKERSCNSSLHARTDQNQCLPMLLLLVPVTLVNGKPMNFLMQHMGRGEGMVVVVMAEDGQSASLVLWACMCLYHLSVCMFVFRLILLEMLV